MRNTIPWHLGILALTSLPFLACSPEPVEVPPQVAVAPITADLLEKNTAAWQKERQDRLREPDSWLSLVGLDWLTEGENTVGSDPDSDVVLPASLPSRVGVIQLAEGKATLTTADDVEVTVGAEATTSTDLAPDTSGEPTVVHLDSVLFYLIERGDQMGVRVKDSAAESLVNFEGLEYYPADLSWHVTATLEPYDPPKQIPVPNVLGQVTDSPSPGALVFEIEGEIHRLDALEGSDGGFFVIFNDATNGSTTYGAGRFLYTDAPAENGDVVVDFNRAYNPPCVFTPYATCPLPPPQNKLALEVTAGEKNYTGGHH